MKSRFFSLFFALLSLGALSTGCPTAASHLGGAPNDGGGVSSTTVGPAHEDGPGAGTVAGGGGSEVAAGPVVADGAGVLAPRPDSERLGEDTAFVALYGPGFSQRLSPTESGGIDLPRDGHVDLSLRIQRLQSTADSGLVAVDADVGLQVRLIQVFTDAYGKLRYRHCDALTSAVKAEGYNVNFTGLDLSASGQVQVFVVNPVPPGRAPTADFSAACADFPAETTNDMSFIANLILARNFLFVGTFQLMIPLY